MSPAYFLLAYLILVGFVIVLWRHQILAVSDLWRESKHWPRAAGMKLTAQPVDYWLEILNQGANQELIAYDTMVLRYMGQEFFFVNGGIAYITFSNDGNCNLMKSCFLIAVDQLAVRILSEQEPIFRLIRGTTELAAFSIYRWSDFVTMLMREKHVMDPYKD